MTSDDKTTEQSLPDAHVVFELEIDEDGWPPTGGERLWAFSLGNDLYRIDNVPWLVRDLAIGDIVRALPPTSGQHPVFETVIQRSQHVTVRSDALYARMIDDARHAQPQLKDPGGQTGNDTASSATGSHPETPALRKSHSRADTHTKTEALPKSRLASWESRPSAELLHASARGCQTVGAQEATETDKPTTAADHHRRATASTNLSVESGIMFG